MQDKAARRSEFGKDEGETGNVDEDWDFKWMATIDEIAASVVGNKLKNIQGICEDSGKAVAACVVKRYQTSPGCRQNGTQKCKAWRPY